MRARFLPFLAIPVIAACTATVQSDVIVVDPTAAAGVMIVVHAEESTTLKIKLDGQYLTERGPAANPEEAGLALLETSSRGAIGFAVVPGRYVVELEDDVRGIVVRSTPITLATGSNHLVAFGALDQLAYVAHHDAAHTQAGTGLARVTNALASQAPLDIVVCAGAAPPPAADCEEVASGLGYGATWEAAVPVGHRVHARPPRPAGYPGPGDFTFSFMPDRWFNGPPAPEGPAATTGSLFPFDWRVDDACRFCLVVFETHDGAYQSRGP